MTEKTPVETTNKLVEAMNRQEIDKALALYDSSATMVMEGGKLANGLKAIRTELEGFISLKPILTIESQKCIESGDVALICSKWKLTGSTTEGQAIQMGGVSSDVLRRQTDGRWLIVIDNPWGTNILP
jgi:ketosteroid isomerase-like protein